MREAIFILVVLLLLAGLTVYRYRRQIGAFLRFWRSMKEMKNEMLRRQSETGEQQVAAGPLVLCAKCGNWVPEERSVRLGPTNYFCSTKCLEARVKAT